MHTAGQDGATGTRLTSLPETPKKTTHIWNSIFQDMAPKAMRGSDLWRREVNEASPTIAPAYCLESVSIPWHREGRGSLVEPSGLTELRWWGWERGDTNAAGVWRTESWHREVRQSSGRLHGVCPGLRLPDYSWAHSARRIPKAGGTESTGITPCSWQGPRTILFPHSQSGKSHISWSIG